MITNGFIHGRKIPSKQRIGVHDYDVMENIYQAPSPVLAFKNKRVVLLSPIVYDEYLSLISNRLTAKIAREQLSEYIKYVNKRNSLEFSEGKLKTKVFY